jgi:hypothetical protein
MYNVSSLIPSLLLYAPGKQGTMETTSGRAKPFDTLFSRAPLVRKEISKN